MLEYYVTLQDPTGAEVTANRTTSAEVSFGDAVVVVPHALSQNMLDPENGVLVHILPPEGMIGWMGDTRTTPSGHQDEFWCRPRWPIPGREGCFADVPDETQALLYQKEDGTYGCILPIVGDSFKCVLRGESDGTLTARMFAWAELHRCDDPAFAWQEGDNPYELLRSCTAAGLEIAHKPGKLREERRYPEIFEYLGWCSWDAMQIRVSEEGLLEKCREFREKNIPVRWALIDDMWADVPDFWDVKYESMSEMVRLQHASRLHSFEADPRRFPNGLKGCIEKMKSQYDMKVGMWHPTTGYWFGVDPEGPLAKEYADSLLKTASGRLIPHYERTKAFRCYDGFHGFLKSCGADFVKVDNQTMTRGHYKGSETQKRENAPVGKIASEYHRGLEASVGVHFDNALINCMGMGSEDWWNRPTSVVTRCSGDFQPENREWFSHHITQCSYNSLCQGTMMVCDWDMWWTDDGQAPKNSVLRAISGGPIYISDKLGRSRREYLIPLCLSDGRILRCDRPGTPVRECLFTDPVDTPKLFKLQNQAAGEGVLAVFNLYKGNIPVTGSFSPSDVEGLRPGEKYLVYEHFSGSWQVADYDETISLTLKNQDDFRLYNIIRIRDGFAPVGLAEKMMAPLTYERHSDRALTLRDAGLYRWYENGELKEREVSAGEFLPEGR